MLKSVNKNNIFSKLLVSFALTVVFNFICCDTFCQSNKKTERLFAEARNFYYAENYPEAIEMCKKIIGQNNQHINAYFLLADIYNELDSTLLEIKYLDEVKTFSKNPQVLFRLAEANYKIAEYHDALNFFREYLETAKISGSREEEINRKIMNCRFALSALEKPVDFNPEKLPETINTSDDEYWPVFSLDQKTLVFTRLLKTEGLLPQEDFFMSERDSITWQKPIPLSEINSPENEGAQCLSADGKILFFTACNRISGAGSCDIYYSVFENEKWSAPQNAGKPVSTRAWEAQPGFSSDNRYLYFSSNREGGKGGKDIWRVEVRGKNEYGRLIWGKAENLGDSINTPGDEISPFIHPNNSDFYFVSDYHTGMGGFDIFRARQKPDGSFSTPENIGYPVNTSENEQGLTIAADGKTALFASERTKKNGLDIYTFKLDEEQQVLPATYVKAKVTDAISGESVQAGIQLTNLTASTTRYELTDKNGEALLCLPVGNNYAFNVSKDGYLFYSQSFPLKAIKTIEKPYQVDIQLTPVVKGAEMNLYNIYFETDSFSILPESEPELNKLTTFLKNNPSIAVEIQGHTDNSGDSLKNVSLSEKRAKSVADYLLNQGIDKAILKWKGYGENNPVADNKTIEGRSKNRRTTIKILGKTK